MQKNSFNIKPKYSKYLFRIFILLFYFISHSPILKAQNFIDLINTGTNYVPQNYYESSDSSFSFAGNFINIQYPHVFKNKDVFLVKLSLNNYKIHETNTQNLYNFYLQLGILKNFNKKLSLRFGIAPKIASELKDINKNDLLLPMIGVLQFKASDNFSYGFGALYSKEFFGHFVNPAIYVKWEIDSSWTFYSDFPSHGYLMYHKNLKFNTGIYVSSSTTSFRLSEENNNNYLQKSHTDLSLFFDLYLTKSIVTRVKAGYSTMRALSIYADDDTVPLTFSVFEFDDNRNQLNRNIDSALFFEISLNYRYHY